MTTEQPAADLAAPPAPWVYRIEAWIAAASIRVVGLLSLDRASALGGALARMVGPRLGVSKRARLNLRAAMPELSDDDIERIVRGMWDNLGRVAFEYPHLAKFDVSANNGRIEVHGYDHVARAVGEKRSIVFVGAHLGNWELAALSAGRYGLDVASIYRAANNPLVDAMLARLRGGYGELIPKGATASRRAMATLRRGGHVAMLVDQKLNNGIAVPFFGRPAMTVPTPALLALHYDCDVLPARVERLKGAHFRLTVYPPLPLPRSGDRDADALALMTGINQMIESWIRERPEQWFWLHRRWPD
jgi:KDO2-lipid IV(A) lauroyltransferase